jgi:uncharacterized protein (DUF302 family)
VTMAFEITLSGAYDEAIEQVTEALKTEGFGVLTRIDVHTTLKDKLGVEFRPYAILGACNPGLAHRALSSNTLAGLLLPCNVTVEATPNGHVVVRIADPDAMLQTGGLTTDQRLRDVAHEARARLSRVAEALRHQQAAA